MRIFIILLFLHGILPAGIVIADMKEIESIRTEVGQYALIVPVSDNNCDHIYIVKKKDGSIWTYSANYSANNYHLHIVKKALIFHGDKQYREEKEK